MLAGVSLELGAVQGDVAEFDQTRFTAQPEDLAEQPGERLKMTLPEVADGPEVGPLQRAHRHEVEPLLQRPGDPPRGIDALAVGVEQQSNHHRRVVGRVAARLVVGRHDGAKVERLAHQITHRVRRMPGRHEVVDRGRQQPRLIDVPRTKGLAHAPSNHTNVNV